jgi:iron-sulfur cluster repair protein YtfE (RIC family)
MTVSQDAPVYSPRRGRFTIVYLIHDAFRRDLARLSTAVASAAGDAGRAQQLQRHWEFVSEQLHHHHRIEDESLWPLVRSKLVHQPDDRQVLDEMEGQHLALDPTLRAVDEGFAVLSDEPNAARAAELAARIDDLGLALGQHLDAEERSCFPIVDWALTIEEFRSFGKAAAKAAGLRASARLFPWIFDQAYPADRQTVLAVPPRPVQVLCRLVWEPRYRRYAAQLWGR